MRLVALVMASAMMLGSWAMPASAEVSAEDELLSLINEARDQVSLPPLTMLGDLVDDARRHSEEMLEAGDLFHSKTRDLTEYTTDWELLGENVGLGPTVAALHRAFMLSPSHAQNVLGDFSSVGIGAQRAEDGTLFVTVVFMQPAAADDDRRPVLSPLADLSGFTAAAPSFTIPDRWLPQSDDDGDVRCVAPTACLD